MNRDEWFFLSLPIVYGIGYLYGRFALPKMLHFPFPARMVGRSAFLILTLFFCLRTAWTYFFAHNHFDSWLTITAYVDIAILSLGTTNGYAGYTLSSPQSLKSAIKAAREDGIILANPFEVVKK